MRKLMRFEIEAVRIKDVSRSLNARDRQMSTTAVTRGTRCSPGGTVQRAANDNL